MSLLTVTLSDGRTLTGWRTLPYLPLVLVYMILALVYLVLASILAIPALIKMIWSKR